MNRRLFRCCPPLILGLLAIFLNPGNRAGSSSLAREALPSAQSEFDPTHRYKPREINGWRVLVSDRLQQGEPELCAKTLTLLDHQLYQLVRRVPVDAVEKLRKIPIWVELEEPRHPCMCYHVDPGWLRDHGMNPEKAKGVEIANARNFLIWTHDQPWMVLHELAHGFHHQFLEGGYENLELAEALKFASEEKLYDSVLRISGKTERHYALTNQMEYFAEQTEAYFGTNDFFPFVRSELKQHDPRMFELVGKLWGVSSAR